MAGLLETVARNLSRKNEDLKIYEVGTTHHAVRLPLDSHPEEVIRLCGAMVGRRDGTEWCHSRENVDFFDAKGVVESLLSGLGVGECQVVAATVPWLHPGKQADFMIDGQSVATVGELHPSVQEAFGINRPVYLFKINLTDLAPYCSTGAKAYSPLPKYPAINRDIALVLSDSVPAADVLEAVRSAGGELLVESRLFDVYAGERVEKGTRSLAISLVYRAADRTLTDEEVDAPLAKLVQQLETTFAAKLRS